MKYYYCNGDMPFYHFYSLSKKMHELKISSLLFAEDVWTRVTELHIATGGCLCSGISISSEHTQYRQLNIVIVRIFTLGILCVVSYKVLYKGCEVFFVFSLGFFV